MCQHVLGLEPLAPTERPKSPVSHAEKERRNLAAATQFRAREGHLDAPRSHKEEIVLDDGSTEMVSLGLFLTNTRNRTASIPTECANRLTQLGMRWQ